MEIELMRKELTQLLDNIVEHSNRYSDDRAIPSLEIGAVLTKISRLQEGMSVLRFLLEEREKLAKQRPNKATRDFDVKIVVDQEEVAEKKEVIPEVIAEVIETPIQQEEVIEAPVQQEVVVEENVRFEQPSIPKLIDALTLNDRYLYANELFEKDMSAFNNLVKSIDNSLSLNEAKALLIPLNWEDENEHVVSFTNLVERRFL
jgi:hypothetical protein